MKPKKETLCVVLFASHRSCRRITAWSVEPSVGTTPTVSLDPHGMMLSTTSLPQAHYVDYSTVF
jgi:hypothetical protein